MNANWNSQDKFNREASKWDENPQRRALALSVSRAMINTIKPDYSMNVLEFGCGTGLVTLQIAPLVKHLSAVDTSNEMLVVLQDKIRASGITNIETRCMNLSLSSGSDFPEKSFELIYGSMTLHHIDDTAEFLKRISGLLSPGGILAIADLDLEDGLFHDDSQEKVHPGFDRGELTALFYNAGLQTRSFETIDTIHKTSRSGVDASYPVFLSVTSRNNP